MYKRLTIYLFCGLQMARMVAFFNFPFISAGVVQAQEVSFIGCRTADGWAESPMLRKRFTLTAEDFKRYDFQKLTFSVNVASLGYHEVYVNDRLVGDRCMQPAVSQLNKRALMVDYDITDYVREGENVIMLWLGQGWGRIYGTPAAARVVVERCVSDEECGLITEIVWSDTTWESSPSGYSYTGSWQPLQFGGERYDARVKTDWRPASRYDAEGIVLSQQEFGGNRIVGGLEPVDITYNNEYILVDFGHVVTGWFQADFLPQPEGHEITMEYLDDLNSTYSETDIYVSDGMGDDDIHFSNRFHMHAFRYVRIRGINTANKDIPDLYSARALQISAVDPKEGATFDCSDPRLNAIHNMIKYTLSCLTFSGYMVDCPHLERMGYGGDGNASTMTLQTMWDVRDSYLNWLTAWGDAMEEDGELPYVAPAFYTGGGPYWCSFIVKAPWNTYMNYGDKRLVFRYYDKMKRWMQYVEDHSVDGILQPWPDNERHGWFLGDWLAPDGVDIKGESVLHVNSCVVSECLGYMEKMAMFTGHLDDTSLFAERRARVNAAIHRRFYHPETNTYANGTPLDQAYALLMDVPPDSATRQAVKERLLEDCHGKWRDHIAVGLVGVPVFTEWCIREKEAGLMATILRQDDYPGYLNMMDGNYSGTNTTWESWNGKRSRVHNCYNGIGIWFYQALAGIRPDPMHPGYKHFFFDPQPVASVDTVSATVPTRYGDITVEITPTSYTITVPPGATATVVPAGGKTVGPGTWRFEK